MLGVDPEVKVAGGRPVTPPVALGAEKTAEMATGSVPVDEGAATESFLAHTVEEEEQGSRVGVGVFLGLISPFGVFPVHCFGLTSQGLDYISPVGNRLRRMSIAYRGGSYFSA